MAIKLGWILIGILILFLLFYLYKRQQKFKAVILLTTSVIVQKKLPLYQTDKEERIKTYVKSIKQYLEKTNLPIVVIENTGYDFSKELKNEIIKYRSRFEIISFNEHLKPDCLYLSGNMSKGNSELFSIYYAFYNSRIIQNSNFIIKITGRYFVSELEEYLEKTNLHEYHAIIQNQSERCEIVGSSYEMFDKIFNPYFPKEEDKYNGHAESIFEHRMNFFPKKTILVLPRLHIEPTKRGGLNEIFTFL